jgi:hypothetical protein
MSVAVYLLQQLDFSRQQAPGQQLSAEREDAVTEVTSATAVKIINRYFIESSC